MMQAGLGCAVFCAVLCCAVLCCAVLCCAVLCCAQATGHGQGAWLCTALHRTCRPAALPSEEGHVTVWV